MNTPQDNVLASVVASADVHACSKSNLHYRLTNEEWLTVSKDLRPAELIVLFHLRTLDPFGDRKLDLKVIDIAEATGLKKGTVSKALKVLSHKEYIDLELVAISVRVKKFPPGNQFPTGNIAAHQETSQHTRKPDCTPGNFQEPEPIQAEASRSLHTIQTNKTIQTLSLEPESDPKSELERETLEVDEDQLLEFATNKVKQSSEIKRPRAYAKRCVKDDRGYWIAEFRKWRQLQEQINVPISPISSTDFFVETIDQQRERLIRMWNFVPCRPGIRNAIETQPDLKLQIVEGELREV